MLDSISDIANDAQTCHQTGYAFAFPTLKEELRATCSPLRMLELLNRQPDNALRGRLSHRASRLLQKAAIAARCGNAERCAKLQQDALDALEGNREELDALVEMHRLTFAVTPLPQAERPRVRSGFVR